MAKVTHCEYCGADLGGPVEKWSGEFVVCGERECQREATAWHREQRDQAHEQLDRDRGWE